MNKAQPTLAKALHTASLFSRVTLLFYYIRPDTELNVRLKCPTAIVILKDKSVFYKFKFYNLKSHTVYV